MIRRLLNALDRRLRRFATSRADRRLARTFRRAGATMHGACTAIGPMRPLILNTGILQLGRNTVWQSRTLRTEIHVRAGATLTIGDRVFLNQGITIATHLSVVIGPDCLLGEQVAIHDNTFHSVSPDRPRKTAPVRLGRNVWLGHRAIVLPGVEIGDHTVVGAGSVVTHSLPDRCIAVGAPARIVGTFTCPDDWRRS